MSEGIVTRTGRSGAMAGPYGDVPLRIKTIYDRFEDIPVEYRKSFFRAKDGKWYDIDRYVPRVDPYRMG